MRKEMLYLFATPSYGMVLLRLSFLSILPLALALSAIWMKNINTFFLSRGLKKYHLVFILILLSIFAYVRVYTSEPFFGDNWYPHEEYDGVSYRWLSDGGVVSVYSGDGGLVFLNLSLDSFYRNRTLDLFLNGGFVGEYFVSVNGSLVWSLVNLSSGVNVLRFHSVEGCDVPLELGVWNDSRCLSFNVRGVGVVSLDDLLSGGGVLFSEGWYRSYTYGNVTYRWMGEDGTISLFSRNGGPVFLNISLESFYVNRTLELFLNGVFVDEYVVSPNVSVVWSPLLNLSFRGNVLRLHSSEGCDVPSVLGVWNDSRCLSFSVRGVDVLYVRDLEPVFRSGWFPVEV
ncbi:MAG: hypothetical protein V1921_08830, partial [Candidatus Altiarchaeota archaeon]